jgi:2-phospho-L-lactate guanylyltransferase
MSSPAPVWGVIVPVKDTARGKSRLAADGLDRSALARAIALDTIAAAAACPLVAQVVVVTDDGGLVLAAADIPGLRFVAETPTEAEAVAAAETMAAVPSDGLNRAIARGAAALDGMPRAALLGDLPALRPEDLADALRLAATAERAVVADAEGTGSTLVTAAAGVPWRSAFGDGSLRRHIQLGCTLLEVADASTLRRDVDTAAQLAAAAELGLGPRTAALVAGEHS